MTPQKDYKNLTGISVILSLLIVIVVIFPTLLGVSNYYTPTNSSKAPTYSKNQNSIQSLIDTSLANSLGLSPNKEGEKYFKLNCKTCHNIYEDLTGPALKDVTKRHDRTWLASYIRGPKSLYDQGDKEAKVIIDKWKDRSGIMPAFNLKDEEISAILDHIDYQSCTIDQ